MQLDFPWPPVSETDNAQEDLCAHSSTCNLKTTEIYYAAVSSRTSVLQEIPQQATGKVRCAPMFKVTRGLLSLIVNHRYILQTRYSSHAQSTRTHHPTILLLFIPSLMPNIPTHGLIPQTSLPRMSPWRLQSARSYCAAPCKVLPNNIG